MPTRLIERLVDASAAYAMAVMMPMAVAGGSFGAIANDEKAVKAAKAKGIQFVDLGPEMQSIWDKVRESEPAAVAKATAANGATDAEQQIKVYLEVLKKWEGIVDRIGMNDRPAFETALWDEVYSKVKF